MNHWVSHTKPVRTFCIWQKCSYPQPRATKVLAQVASSHQQPHTCPFQEHPKYIYCSPLSWTRFSSKLMNGNPTKNEWSIYEEVWLQPLFCLIVSIWANGFSYETDWFEKVNSMQSVSNLSKPRSVKCQVLLSFSYFDDIRLLAFISYIWI